MTGGSFFAQISGVDVIGLPPSLWEQRRACRAFSCASEPTRGMNLHTRATALKRQT